MNPFPTRRAAHWAVLSPPVRDQVLRLLVQVEGVDGYSGVCAIADALRSDGSPWAPVVDECIGRAVRELVFEPLAAFGRALVAAFTPAVRAVAEAVSAFVDAAQARGLRLPGPPTGFCGCLCPTHPEWRGVCLGEVPVVELVGLPLPYLPLPGLDTKQPRTVAVCGPCAAARAGGEWPPPVAQPPTASTSPAGGACSVA